MRKLIAIAAAVVLTGCATSYKPLSGNFGYTHTRLAPNIFEVTFRGNAAMKPEQASDYALLRSAELSLVYGYRYFVIVSGKSAVATSSYVMPGQANTTTTANAYGNTVRAQSQTNYTPGQTLVFEMPRTTNTVIASKEKPDVNGIVYDAEFIWQELATKHKVERAPAL